MVIFSLDSTAVIQSTALQDSGSGIRSVLDAEYGQRGTCSTRRDDESILYEMTQVSEMHMKNIRQNVFASIPELMCHYEAPREKTCSWL